jgi:hypothetical protein
MSTFTMNAPVAAAAPLSSPRPWWREPYVWLVVGGPLIVVVAGITTAYIAMKDPDPLINTQQQQQKLIQQQTPAGEVATKDDLVKLVPASQARNHAASPVVPGASK